MNKKEAIKRLDAIEAEAKELRKILEQPDRLIYDSSKLYITNRARVNGGIQAGPYLMKKQYNDDQYQMLGLFNSTAFWSYPTKSGQEAIDYLINSGFEVKEFLDQKSAFKYLLSQVE